MDKFKHGTTYSFPLMLFHNIDFVKKQICLPKPVQYVAVDTPH